MDNGTARSGQRNGRICRHAVGARRAEDRPSSRQGSRIPAGGGARCARHVARHTHRFRRGARTRPGAVGDPERGPDGRISVRARTYRRALRSRATLIHLLRRRLVVARFDSFDRARALGNFNPSAFRQDPQIPLSYLEPLVRPDPTTMRPTPWLAQRWEWRADGLELVFLLRDGVHWHDGAALTAADAAFTFEVYRTDTDSAVSELFALVDSLDAISERELRVAVHRPRRQLAFQRRNDAHPLQRSVRPVLARDAGERADTVGVRLVE